MGADWKDTNFVGSLVGTKTILNEFIAYTKLAEELKNRTISVNISFTNLARASVPM